MQIALSLPDVAGVIYDLQHSSPGDSWLLTATQPRISVTPSPAQVTANQRVVNFTASVDGFPVGPFIYKWTSTGQNGQVSVSDPAGYTTGATGPAQYVATTPLLPSGVIDEVTVEVSRVTVPGGSLEDVGEATVQVFGPTTQYVVDITPATVNVAASGTTQLTAVLTPAYQGAGLFFRWSTTGNFGTISPTPGTLSGFQTATYSPNVGAVGTDMVRVDVFGDTGDSLGTATATVTVVPPDPIHLTGGYEITQVPAGGAYTCVEAYLWIPLVSGVLHYDVDAHGFNDTAFWGTRIQRTFSPPFPTHIDCNGVHYGSTGQVGNRYYYFLTGSASQNPGAVVASFQSRFNGMIVDVTGRF